MRISFIKGVAITAWLAASGVAQDTPHTFPAGGFDHQGSATFGYRFTDVSGYQAKFDELFNLRSGPRLLDFNLSGNAKEGENRFADGYSLTASGMGGDPFTATQLTVRKNRVYDLRASFRNTRYYWNRNDLAALPNGFSGLTSNHDWATVRKFGNVNLLVHASNNLRFSFEYYRTSRDGVAFTTRSPDYFGSPNSWGSFARANPYYVIAPVEQVANRVTGGLDYTRNSWSLHYKLGNQTYDDAVHGNNLISLQRSINPDSTTANERLNSMSWTDSRRLSTPVSEFSYAGRLHPRLETRGGYIFYRYRGPASLDFAFDGKARSGTQFIAYAVAMNGRAEVSEPNHVIDQGFTYKVAEWFRAQADYRYSRFSVDSTGTYRSLNNSVVASGTADNRWYLGTSTLDFNLVFTPLSSLLIRPGIRYFKNDIKMLQDGVVDLNRTRRVKTVWPTLSAYYEPSKMFTIRADVEQITNGTSYTRVTPHTDIGGRFVVRIRPTDRFYIEDSAVLRNRTLLQTDYRATIRSNAVTANYDFSEKVAVFAGFSYDDLFAANFVNFPLRGTPPFTNLALRDQTVTRIWQGGFRAVPVKGLGVNFAGNFVRTTGVGEIAGEAPLYGPMSFPYASGSVYYDVPRFGRLMLQLQRTYYIEQIVPGNNFGANLLTIAWTRGFQP